METTRRTKIIATLGPATESADMIEQLITQGMNLARINMTHATHDQARHLVKTVREVAQRLQRNVGVLMDLQGPAIRTGDLPVELDLNPGERIVLSVRGETSEEHHSVDVNYDQLVDDIQVGDTVIVDNGVIHLKVLEKRHNQLHCEVLTEGTLGSRRHINLPGVRVNLPALTEKDMRDVDLGIEIGVDYIAMSFVREADDVLRLKAIIDYQKSSQKVIAKLEDQEAIKNLEDIIDEADGIMVARGDLGIEIPYEELPIVQRLIVKTCVQQGKPVIVATHILESMIENPLPTRAEITDLSNAVFEQADAIMLSGETSIGAYPDKCIEVMNRVARRVERSGGAGYADDPEMKTKGGKMVKAAGVMAEEMDSEGLVVFTRTGSMARNASRLRMQQTPVFAFTDNRNLIGQLSLLWGVRAFFIELTDRARENVERAIHVLKEHDLIDSGENVVAITEVKVDGKTIDSIQIEMAD